MNTRICSIIASVTLLIFSSGCGSTRNFLFGRGARCGLCNRASTPAPPPAMQAPCGQTPYAAPAYGAPQCQTPAYQGSVVTAPASGCGCNGNTGNVDGGQAYAGNPCGSCGDGGQAYAGNSCGGCADYGMTYGGGECGGDCGNVVGGYGPVVTDPYTNGGIVGGSVPYNGVVGEQVIGGQVYPGTSAPIQSDNFDARVNSQKFDSDGNRILWEQPLPQGTTAL